MTKQGAISMDDARNKTANATSTVSTVNIYDTLSRAKRRLETREPGKIGIYVCGVTPYDYTHIGHARVAVLWDVFRRYFRYLGYHVRLVQNFTDVDDKIIAKANAEGLTAKEVAERYIADYEQVMAELGVEPPDVAPRVTGEMAIIIALIQDLVDKGYAYEAGGDVFYDVNRFAEYGKLSGRTAEEMEAGARIEVSPLKRSPMDFALWKAAKPGEPAWDSPWGPGRPGWHIECSAMSLKYLGAGFDIHGGGLDLVFPHHENEIAQSEASLGHPPFARYWVHNGMVEVDREKMSKSIGNTTAVRAVLEKWRAPALRYFLLSGHYRRPLLFSPAELDNADKSLERLEKAYRAAGEARAASRQAANGAEASEGGEAAEGDGAASDVLRRAALEARDGFIAAMSDDLNTALAIAQLHNLAREVNRVIKTSGWSPGPADKEALQAVVDTFRELGHGILGVLPEKWELVGRSATDSFEAGGGEAEKGLVNSLMDLVLELRALARQRKDYQTADHIREKLREMGVVVEDTPQGTRWELVGRR